MSSRPTFLALLANCALVACAPNGSPTPASSLEPSELIGRVAGAPQRCLPVETTEALRYGGERVVLYGRGRTVWANRLPAGCAGLRSGDVFLVRPLGNRHCEGDLLQSRDPVSGTAGPGCRLGVFTPYRR